MQLAIKYAPYLALVVVNMIRYTLMPMHIYIDSALLTETVQLLVRNYDNINIHTYAVFTFFGEFQY